MNRQTKRRSAARSRIRQLSNRKSKSIKPRDEDQHDEEEAQDYVSRALAELEFEAKYGNNEEHQDDSDDLRSKSMDELPTVPSDAGTTIGNHYRSTVLRGLRT